MAVLEVLEREDGFTDIEADLARYICANADEVCRMTISDLAKASFTSNATIVRLCRKVGVKGYRDLRVELAADLEKRRQWCERLSRIVGKDLTEDFSFMLGD